MKYSRNFQKLPPDQLDFPTRSPLHYAQNDFKTTLRQLILTEI